MPNLLTDLWQALAGSAVPGIRPAGLSQSDLIRALGLAPPEMHLWLPGSVVSPPPHMLEFFAYQTTGATIGHTASLARIPMDEPAAVSIPFDSLPTHMIRGQTADSVIFDELGDIDLGVASAAVNGFTRTRMREDGFFRRVMPPAPLQNQVLSLQHQALDSGYVVPFRITTRIRYSSDLIPGEVEYSDTPDYFEQLYCGAANGAQ